MTGTRVVHVSSVHKATDARIFEKQCKTLARAGFDVLLIAGEPEGPVSPAVKVISFPQTHNRVLRIIGRPAVMCWKAARARPHIIHLHDPELIPCGILLRLLGFKVVFDSHEDLPENFRHKTYLPPAARRLAALMSHGLVRVADFGLSAIVAATPHIAERYRNPIVATVRNYPAVDEWNSSPSISRQDRRMVYIGGIAANRGLWTMLDATALLSESHGARLTLAGPIAPELLVQLKNHRAWPHIDYVGNLSRSEVADLLASATVGLCLLLPEPAYVNSIPTKLFEYMAAGLPSVASHFPEWEKMLAGPVGLVADPECPESVAAAVARIFENPDLASDMAARGRERVLRETNWANEGETLVAMYRQLLRE